MPRRIFFWLPYTDRILTGLNPPGAIGGANVQFAFWAKCFADHGWKPYAITCYLRNANKKIFGINYIYFPEIKYLNVFLQYFQVFFLILLRPQAVVTRTQPVFGLNLLFYLSKILKFKLIHTLASDLEVLTEGIHKLSSFQKVLKKLDFVIAQNEYQKLVFKKNIRNIEIPVIPNIWDSSIFESMNKTTDLFFDVIWVGNIRHIKRPEYFLELARAYPDLKFGMIGIKIEKNLYEICKSASEELSNLQLLGYRNLYETTYIISKSKVLICTSINEGFPNTFLQAWSVPIPVLSTVNPNKAITRFDLGIVADKLDGLSAGLTKILSDNGYYKKLQKNITNYFGVTHSPEINYEVFESYIK